MKQPRWLLSTKQAHSGIVNADIKEIKSTHYDISPLKKSIRGSVMFELKLT